MTATPEVLVISTRTRYCKPLVSALDKMGLKVHTAFNVQDASRAFSPEISLACCDDDLFAEVSRMALARGLPARLLLISAGDCGNYLEAMEHGAFDCLPVPIDPQETRRIVENALRDRVLAAHM